MRKLTAAGQPWAQVKDEFDLAVDEVMPVAEKYGMTREDIEKMMKELDEVKDRRSLMGRVPGRA